MSIIYDSLKTVSISFLKTHKYLEPGTYKGGNIAWSYNGQPSGNIDIRVNMNDNSPYLELIYRINGTSINYRVKLVNVQSNLGFGQIWYFICPATGKRCRKLYSIGNYFYHRTACRGLYETQTKSKFYKLFEKAMGGGFASDQLYERLHQKNFKETYAGRPTRTYLTICKKLERLNRMTPAQLKHFFETH